MRSCEAAAHVPRCSQQVLILVLQSLLLCLADKWGALLGQNLIVPPEYEVYIVLKLREEAFEARRKMAGWLKRAVDKIIFLLCGFNTIFLVRLIALIIIIVRILMLNLSVLALFD